MARKIGNNIVSICGYEPIIFSWHDNYLKNIYQTSGLLISYGDKQLVITTRDKLILCKTIIIYHINGKIIMRNEAQISFHSIELNLIILTSKNCDTIDFTKSTVINKYFFDNKFNNAYPIQNNITIYKKNTKAIAVSAQICDSKKLKYLLKNYDIKFVDSLIWNKTYTPETYMYQFSLSNKKTIICGTPVFGIVDHKFIGCVSYINGNQLYVLPGRAIMKIVTDYFHYFDKIYHGLATLPFVLNKLEIIENYANTQVGDIISKIDNIPVVLQNDEAVLFDPNYQTYIPIDIYVSLEYHFNQSLKIELVENNTTKLVNINCARYNNPVFTNMPAYRPEYIIPHVNISGLIIVQFTHELYDIMLSCKIKLQNQLIKCFLDSINYPINILLIIDSIYPHRHIPKINLLDTDNVQCIKCPWIGNVDGVPVNDLIQLQEMPTIKKIQIFVSKKKKHIITI